MSIKLWPDKTEAEKQSNIRRICFNIAFTFLNYTNIGKRYYKTIGWIVIAMIRPIFEKEELRGNEEAA